MVSQKPAISYYSEPRFKGSAKECIETFTSALCDVIKRLDEDLKTEDYGKFGGRTAPVAQAIAGSTESMLDHANTFRAVTLSESYEPEIGTTVRNVVANVVNDSGFARIARTRMEIPKAKEGKFDQGLTGKLIEEAGNIGQKIETIGEIFGGPAEKVLKTIGVIVRDIGIIGKLAADVSGGNEVGEQLENKLDFVAPLVQDIEDKIENLYPLITGNPLPRNPDGRVAAPPTDRAPFPRLPGSVLWMSWELERKLEHVFARLVGENFPRNVVDGGVIAPIVRKEGSVEKVLEDLCFKVETLARLLGKTLFDTDWNVKPDSQTLRTVPRGARAENATPPRSIKDELHGIEDMLQLIIQLLRRRNPPPVTPTPPVMPPPVPPPFPPIPPEFPPEDDFFATLKRIFVYEEGVYEATSATDEKQILVRTGAFDLAGWVDLSEMQDGDNVDIEMYVLLPGGVRRLFKSQNFNGSADARLVALNEVTGPIIVVGNAVDIIIRLNTSTTGFAPPIRIPYQFVVESQ